MLEKDSERTTQPNVVDEVKTRIERVNSIIGKINKNVEGESIDQMKWDSDHGEDVYSDLQELYSSDVSDEVKRDLIDTMQLFCEINEFLVYREESHYDHTQIEFQNENEA